MGRIDNLNESPMARQQRQVRKQGTKSPIGWSSVSEGGLEIRSNEGLTVEGSQKVSGWLIVTGTLKVVGTFLLEGLTQITGDVTITGKLLINGLAELTKTLTLKTGGSIIVEGSSPITIGQSGGAAVISMSSAKVYGNASGGVFGTDVAVVSVTSAGPMMTNLAGSCSVLVQSDKTTISGALATSASITAAVDVTANGRLISPNAAPTTAAANAYFSSAGSLLKVSSAARFKIDPQPMDLPVSLLDVPVKSWIDLGNAERFAELYRAPRPLTEREQSDYDDVNLKRVPGVIAEEVEAAGGEPFVTRDSDGLIQGVAYDRYALARTGMLWQKLSALIRKVTGHGQRIRALEKEVSELRALLVG